MAEPKPFLIMTKIQAARFAEETATDEHRLVPTLIRGGGHAGKYALPERVLYDDNYIERRDALRMLDVVSLVIAEAFPPTDDD